MGYLEVQYLVSKYLGTFQISVIDFQFSLLWSDNVIYMISIFINLWKLFGSIMWSILVNIPCVLVKNVYYAFFGCSVDKFQLRSIYGQVFYNLLIVFIFVFSNIERHMVKSPTVIVDLYFQSKSFSFVCVESVTSCAHNQNCYALLTNWFIFHQVMPLYIFGTIPCFEILIQSFQLS